MNTAAKETLITHKLFFPVANLFDISLPLELKICNQMKVRNNCPELIISSCTNCCK